MISFRPILCIPRVFPNIDETKIRNIFNALKLGEIMRVDIVKRITTKGENFNRIFVHFSSWFDNDNSKFVHQRLLDGKEIKIIYDDPWFWKVSIYRDISKNNRVCHPPKHNRINNKDKSYLTH